MKKSLFFFIAFTISLQFAFTQEMNNKKLEEIFKLASDTLIGQPGSWELHIGELPMLCITDEKHNRMRIITPIKTVEESSAEEIMNCMEANFHTALDVKYAISDGVIWVAFIHPLKELSEVQVIDALSQVWAGAMTYGTTYSSTNLTFPKREESEKEIEKKEEGKGVKKT